jgi:hypothetical protein
MIGGDYGGVMSSGPLMAISFAKVANLSTTVEDIAVHFRFAPNSSAEVIQGT